MIDINSNNVVTDRLNNETDYIENLNNEIELAVITLRNSENSDINDDDNFFRSATVDCAENIFSNTEDFSVNESLSQYFQDKENLDEDN